jgi:hypothetical protein
MNSRPNLEQAITAGLAELHALLANRSTAAVVGWCFSHLLLSAHGRVSDDRRLTSPAKQIPFLLSVLLSRPEPEEAGEFGKVEWERARSILEKLFSAYLLLYFLAVDDLGTLAPEWHRAREVSMLAFLNYFNNGLLASVQQIVERINTYIVPFDSELSGALGISASQAVAICLWLLERLQQSIDNFQASAEAVQKHRDRAKAENWSRDKLQEATQDPEYVQTAKQFVAGMEAFGTLSLADLKVAFPGIGEIFWTQFSVARGEAPEIRYPTELSIVELTPLIRISDTESMCATANGLLTALLLVCERTLLKSPARDRYLRSRDKALERETLAKIKLLLSSKAAIWSEVFETADSQFEHDVIAVDEGLCLIVEAKASPPMEPFRDPDKAFVRLRNAFRADVGIQKAYEQGNRVVRRLKTGDVVPLYDAQGNEVGRLLPDQSKLVIGVCVTRDSFGALATNLALLLEKDVADAYPWVVNILDLANLADAWRYFKWGPVELRRYLEQRILLHGKVLSDDELDYAGFFIRHGNFDSALKVPADLVQLEPHYSSLFDDIYRHLYLGEPPVSIKKTEPVMADFRRSLASGKTDFVDPEARPGSGKKYKRCHGVHS